MAGATRPSGQSLAISMHHDRLSSPRVGPEWLRALLPPDGASDAGVLMTSGGGSDRRGRETVSQRLPGPADHLHDQIVDLDRHRLLDVVEGRSRDVLGGWLIGRLGVKRHNSTHRTNTRPLTNASSRRAAKGLAAAASCIQRKPKFAASHVRLVLPFQSLSEHP